MMKGLVEVIHVIGDCLPLFLVVQHRVVGDGGVWDLRGPGVPLLSKAQVIIAAPDQAHTSMATSSDNKYIQAVRLWITHINSTVDKMFANSKHAKYQEQVAWLHFK